MPDIYAGVDLGGTKVACALGNSKEGLRATKTIATQSEEGPEAVGLHQSQGAENFGCRPERIKRYTG